MLFSIRSQARRDIRGIAIYFAREGRPSIPAKFRNAIEQTLQFLVASPEAGVLCGFTGNSRELRKWPVHGFPNILIFYRVDGDSLAVVRVLHGSRDVESIFG
jgi:toxin ParE1/3/4